MEIREQLNMSRKELNRIINKARSRLKNAPPGTLSIYIEKGNPYYYLNIMEDGKRRKHYLRKQDSYKISSLAQKDFDKQIINAAEKQKKCIDDFLKEYDGYALRNIYAKLSPQRKQLIEADIVDDEEYARRWMSVEYEPGRFEFAAGEYYTLKGERVRSKSEKIIADALFQNGIPYRYEYPLHLNNGQTWRPDFTILNKRTREEFILEHFGMMDDPDYCAGALGKLHVYMENGYFPGENLLITAESSSKPLNTKTLDILIDHYLK